MVAAAACSPVGKAGSKSYYPVVAPSRATPNGDQRRETAILVAEIPSPTRARTRRRAVRNNSASCLPSLCEVENQAFVGNPASASTAVPSFSQPPLEVAPSTNPPYSELEAAFGVVKAKCARPPENATAKTSIPEMPRFSWEVNPEEIQLGEFVGTGASADVRRGSWHGTDVAVKCLRGRNKDSMPALFQRELAVLLDLRHPNLVLFMGACFAPAVIGGRSQRPPMIVSEFCEGGTVFQLLHERQDLELSWRQRLRVAVDTAKGMNFLHCRRVVHRDLKSLNLLLASVVSGTEDMPCTKISDFGLSRHLPPDKSEASMLTGGLGTCLWMAPEVLSGAEYSEKVDVYAYGIFLFELICRQVPFALDGAPVGAGLEPILIALSVSRGGRPDLQHLPASCPDGLRTIMEQCWAQNPAVRPAFGATLEYLKAVPCA